MWLMRTDHVSVFRVEMSRGAWVAEAMLGADFKGAVCSDFYGVYRSHDDWVHGYCGAHTIREAKKLAELEPCTETEEFRDRLTGFYVAGKYGHLAPWILLRAVVDAGTLDAQTLFVIRVEDEPTGITAVRELWRVPEVASRDPVVDRELLVLGARVAHPGSFPYGRLRCRLPVRDERV